MNTYKAKRRIKTNDDEVISKDETIVYEDYAWRQLNHINMQWEELGEEMQIILNFVYNEHRDEYLEDLNIKAKAGDVVEINNVIYEIVELNGSLTTKRDIYYGHYKITDEGAMKGGKIYKIKNLNITKN